jgi:hypothetical protein
MSSNSHNSFTAGSASAADETLRLVANLPAPDGLEDRIHKVLRSAPRQGVVLPWPAQSLLRRDWMRASAAAAIAFVVAGGGWGVYSRVQHGQLAIPAHVAAPGGFSGAGAIRTPQTLDGPVVNQPAKAQPVQPKTPKKKTAAHASTPQTATKKTAAAQPAAQPVH